MPDYGKANLQIGAPNRPLTLKEKKAVAEYLKTGKKASSYLAAYAGNKKNVGAKANTFFKKPKIVSALDKALKDSSFDDQYAIKTLKKIVEGGMANIDITRPDTSLKALDTYFKLTNRMGGGPKVPIAPDPESLAKKMDMFELKSSLKELDKKQKRILAIISGRVEEGEIINED